ncbi:Cof-type HAD-IIB family hydrolase [Bacillus sp. SM2101]|uniref:Cof-type HAD-IIB family hydrolase n=1 Tax=Bacillus sp. SM2101 TaxID=2805366 RepID=UPI001BDF2E8E|nr:Cof-type HAD-IIB family hydrolase [Bacillus sp. SM2101]
MKLLAIDLDGTLLNHKKNISKVNLAAIKDAQDNGVEVIIATGRAYFDAHKICRDAELSTKIISSNGAMIHTEKGELLHSFAMENNVVERSIKFLEDTELYYEVTTDNRIYTPHRCRDVLAIEVDRLTSANPEISKEKLLADTQKQFTQTGFTFVNHYQDILHTNEAFYNILAFSLDEEKRQQGWAYFTEQENLTVVSSADNNFELQHHEASKGNAVQLVANMLNIPLSETVAIGDSHNDLSMLKKVGYSVAMGNAKQEIKDICHMTTLLNDEHGVAHAIIHKINEKISL